MTAKQSTQSLVAAFVLAMLSLLALSFGAFAFQASAQVPTPKPDPEFSAPACPPRGLTIDGEIVRVIDGDTVVVRTSIEYHVRLIDCWAPESRTKNQAEKTRGLKSKARLIELAKPETTVRVHVPTATDLTEMLTLGRVLGRIWPMKGKTPATKDLSTIMVEEGLALTQKANK